jgi:hypothetical protein
MRFHKIIDGKLYILHCPLDSFGLTQSIANEVIARIEVEMSDAAL